MTVSVNLSPRQFRDPELLNDIRAVLRDTGLAGERLKLEITESLAMDDIDATIATLRELHTWGVRLAIDDFGTGYSSLSALKRFPFDTLKIDRSFIRGLGTDRDDTAIVHAVIGLAQSLGLQTTAEGVETVQQREALEGLGCTRGQGYHFARPLPAEEMDGLLAAGRPAVLPVDELAAEDLRQSTGQSRRILVIDDDRSIRHLVTDMLADEGYEVRTAADGTEALATLGDWDPDAIVLDLMMPAMDGWAFRAAQRRDAALADIPVVVLSAVHDLPTQADLLDGALTLPKPFDQRTLVAAVDRAATVARARR